MVENRNLTGSRLATEEGNEMVTNKNIKVQSVINSGGGGSSWQPHPDWIDISNVNDNEINLLVSDGSTGVAFAVTTSSGTYTIDWGDGTVETDRVSGTTYSKQYVIGSGQSVNNGQYTVFKIRIYGATGNITRFQVKKHPDYSRTHYSPILWAVFGTQNITNYSYTFYDSSGQVECRDLQACVIPSFANCTDTSYMFRYCSSLSSITLPSSWGSVTNTSSMFNNCNSLSSLTLPTSWGSVTNISGMFYYCTSLSSITLPSSWGSVTNISGMFSYCNSLSSVTLPSSWGSITNTSSMFNNCKSLSSITLPSSWGSITNTSSMFNNCNSLSSITLPSSWGSFTDTNYMFAYCYSLRQLNNLQYLGHQTIAANFTNFLQDAQAISGTLTIASKLSKIGIYGSNGNLLKCTGIRLTNGANTWTGSSPQIDVSYTSLDANALNTLFGDLETVTGKTIRITGAIGAATCDTSIATAKGWSVTN